MATKASISHAKYDAENTTGVYLKLNLKTDSDILEKLSSVPNRQGYIKQLIRQDIAGSVPVSVPTLEKECAVMDIIREIAKTWIDNADTTPEKIDIETAKQYVAWMDPETTPAEMTPEAFMEAWNDIIG